ncbi:DUF1906 domain-containing protein [Streptomyces sp. NPDC003038]|uniref:DUF1906 domain-containing protein n=1 Tax=unclassified Streptomyces TaxID=2593676 RepID=UPI0033ABED62
MAPTRTLLCGLLGAALLIPASPAATADGRSVDYRGLRLTVPADWRVVDLDRDPGACLRLDLPTLYLGHAGTQTDCTAGRAVATRADTLHLEPLDGAPPRADIPTVAVDSADDLPEAPDRPDSNELRYALRRSGVMATVSYGAAPDAVRGILARGLAVAAGIPGAITPMPSPVLSVLSVPSVLSVRPSVVPSVLPSVLPPVPGAAPAAALAGSRTAQQPFTGEGFDACTAPAQRAMDTWRAESPFGAVGVYIGGRARACAQPQLTADWVRRQDEAGWHVMPIWVGPQPWRSATTGLSTDPAAAGQQGRSAAEGAVKAARSLGLAEGTVLYNDLEHYTDRAAWDAPVVSYLVAWTERLHELRYRSGAYVSASSGAKALSAHHHQAPASMPDVLWVARWNGSASVSDADMGLPAGTRQWPGRRRVHQFRGDHNASYGGITINIDRNRLDVDPTVFGADAGGLLSLS